MMSKTFLERRRPDPEYDIVAHITGTKMGDSKIYWHVEVDGESDLIVAAGILERAANVLRTPEDDCG